MIVTENQDGAVTIKPGKDIVASSIEELKTEVRTVYEGGAKRIIMDLEGVNVIDSIGLGLLAETHNSLTKRDSKLELINASENVCNVLNVMRLDRHFSISCAI